MLAAVTSTQNSSNILKPITTGVSLVVDIARRSLNSFVVLSMVHHINAQEYAQNAEGSLGSLEDRIAGTFTGFVLDNYGDKTVFGLQTHAGNVLLAGNIQQDSSDWRCLSSSTIFVAPFNTSGLPSYVTMFEGSDAQIVMTAVAETTDGGFVLGGMRCRPRHGARPILLKIDSTGKVEWSQTVSKCVDKIHTITVLSDGSILAGYGTVLLKLTAGGKFGWCKSLQSTDLGLGALAPLQGASFAVSGGLFVLSEDNPHRGFVAVINNQPSVAWLRVFIAPEKAFMGGVSTSALAVKSDGTIIVVGKESYDVVDGSNIFITSWSQTGQLLQAKIVVAQSNYYVFDGDIFLSLDRNGLPLIMFYSVPWSYIMSLSNKGDALEWARGAPIDGRLIGIFDSPAINQLQILGDLEKMDCSDTFVPGFLSLEKDGSSPNCSWTDFSGVFQIEDFRFQVVDLSILLVDMENVTLNNLTLKTKQLEPKVVQNRCPPLTNEDCSGSLSSSPPSSRFPWLWVSIGVGGGVGLCAVVCISAWKISTNRKKSTGSIFVSRKDQNGRYFNLGSPNALPDTKGEKNPLLEKPKPRASYSQTTPGNKVVVSSPGSQLDKVNEEELNQLVKAFEDHFKQQYAIAVIDSALEESIRLFLLMMLADAVLENLDIDALISQFAKENQDLVPQNGSMPRPPQRRDSRDDDF